MVSPFFYGEIIKIDMTKGSRKLKARLYFKEDSISHESEVEIQCVEVYFFVGPADTLKDLANEVSKFGTVGDISKVVIELSGPCLSALRSE